jgi:sugar phosphate permease
MGVRQMGVPMGGVAGAIVISTTAEYYGYRGALLVTGILVLLITLASAALYREPPQLQGKPVCAGVLLKDLLQMGREPRLLLITLTCMVLFTVQVALMAFFPWTIVHEIGVSSGFAAMVFVIAQFAGAGGRLVWGWLSDRVFHGNRLLPLAITCVLCALGSLAVADLRGMPLAALAGVAVLLGAAAEGWFGLAIIAMAEVGGEEHAGSALGFGLTWVMATAIVTPTIFQSIMQNIGIPTAWHALALLSLAGVIPAAGAIVLTRARTLSVKRAS